VRRGAFTVALIWEFVVALIIAHRGEGDLRWATIRRRLRVNAPLDRRTGDACRKPWWWLAPLVILHFAGALFISGMLDELSVRILLFLAPPGEG
jgi:hypothetical protein